VLQTTMPRRYAEACSRSSRHAAFPLRLRLILGRAACSFGLWLRQQVQVQLEQTRSCCIPNGDHGYICVSWRQRPPLGQRGASSPQSAMPVEHVSLRVQLAPSKTHGLTGSYAEVTARQRANTYLWGLSGNCDIVPSARSAVQSALSRRRDQGLSIDHLRLN